MYKLFVRQTVIVFSFSIFLMYWALTVFFNLPNNYLKIRASRSENYFSFFLSQRWAFFAPPPNYDERIYYYFKKKNEPTIKVIEVLDELFKQKSKKAPFNAKEDILDYVLCNSLGSLSDQYYEAINYKKFVFATKRVITDTLSKRIIKDDLTKSHHFKTILKYGKYVAANSKIIFEYDSVAVVITRIQIPIFANRFDTTKRIEYVFFNSDYMPK